MQEQLPLVEVASVVVLGIGAQWLAWRLRFPSILLLLLFGLAAGPLAAATFGRPWIDPDAMLGEFLMPVISIAVSIILFEGGLSLRLRDLRQIGGAVGNLVTIGVVVSWLLAALAAHFVAGLGLRISFLLGAILAVTGPTVVIPLLRYIRPTARLEAIARWEGIAIDPIGALLAVLVFEALFTEPRETTVLHIAWLLFKTTAVGAGAGLIGAVATTILLARFWIPDKLQNPVVLMLVILTFALSNLLQAEAGLFAVTVMGILMANQKMVSVMHVVEFKENLRTLLLAGLFIMLAARLDMDDLTALSWRSAAFLAVMVLAVRPLAVAASCLGAGLNWREQFFLAWMAPRGIVAASVSSVFALRLASGTEIPDAGALVPLTFLVIIGTVAIYGLTAKPLARRLGVTLPEPQGVLFAGAQPSARAIAKTLQEEDFQVLLVDTNREHVRVAKLEGLPAHYGSVLSERTIEELPLGGIGRLLAITSNDEVNSLATRHFGELFGRAEAYQLPPSGELRGGKEVVSRHLRGRLLFAPQATYSYLDNRFEAGAVVKRTTLTKEFDLKDYRELYGADALPLFLVDEKRRLFVFDIDNPPLPKPGQAIIGLVDPVPAQPAKAATEDGQKPS
jgi:NhaP-type Na+/H+ or K+/H+ antiporter